MLLCGSNFTQAFVHIVWMSDWFLIILRSSTCLWPSSWTTLTTWHVIGQSWGRIILTNSRGSGLNMTQRLSKFAEELIYSHQKMHNSYEEMEESIPIMWPARCFQRENKASWCGDPAAKNPAPTGLWKALSTPSSMQGKHTCKHSAQTWCKGGGNCTKHLIRLQEIEKSELIVLLFLGGIKKYIFARCETYS